MRTAAIIILTMITASMFLVPAHASQISVAVENGQVKETLVLSLKQNVTNLPQQTSTLSLSSDPNLSSAFAGALKATNTSAVPSDLTVNLAASAAGLNITTVMTISGVTGRNGDVLSVDMGWKAFSVQPDVRAGNLSYNTFGSRYLRPVTAFYANESRLVGRPNATTTGVNFFINQTTVSSPVAENYVGNFSLFDFSGLKVPVEGWLRNYTLSNDSTTWQYTPPQPFDFAINVQRLNQTSEFFARYSYKAEITVPGLARAHGDIILLDVGSGRRELVMLGIVVLAVALAIVAQLMFRSRRKKYVKSGRW